MDIQELFEKVRENERKLRTKDGFEGVSFMDDCVTLNGDYDIELRRVKTKGELLGWIAQLAGKNWVTREHIYYFIRIVSDENGIDPYSKDEGDAEINQKDKIIQNLKALVKSVEDELNELKRQVNDGVAV